MPVTSQIIADRMSLAGDSPLRLEHYGFKVYSQSDEDGIIHEIFSRIGTESRVFVDFGAESGTENNSRLLLMQGWTGLWIETVPECAALIRDGHKIRIASGELKFVEAGVTAENINELIKNAGIEGEIDFLSIDIDGNDYHVFEAINVINPRVVCLEHNQCYPPPLDYVMPYNPQHRWSAESITYGASLVALERLAKSKGYVLVGCSLYSPNGYYVRADLINEERFSPPYSAERFFHPGRYDQIVGFPRDESRHILFQSETELAKLQRQVQEANAKLAKLREKQAMLREKLAKAKESRTASWLPKWLRF